MRKLTAPLCALMLFGLSQATNGLGIGPDFVDIDDYRTSANNETSGDVDASLPRKDPIGSQFSNDSVHLERLLDIWNPRSMIAVWKWRDFRLSPKCEDDFLRFLDGLAFSSKWAVKILDASGRYTWGLLSGSRYWIGASDQCRKMESDFIELASANNGSDDNPEVPPFRVSVISVRLVLDILRPNFNASHDVTLGVCMPSNCRPDDARQLIHFSANKVNPDLPRRVTIHRVKNLSEGYNLWEDPVFYIILITFGLVVLLVIFGTLYDLALRYRILSEQAELEGNERVMDIGRTDNCGGRPAKSTKIMQQREDEKDPITILKIWSVKRHNGSLDLWNSKDAPKPMSEALLSFSLLLNISKLVSPEVGEDTLKPIHGLRFVSIIWIILVHTCLMMNEVSENKMFRSDAEENFLFQTISNGTYAVDTFFFISGCLVSFLYFRTITKERIQEKKIVQGSFGKVLQFIGMMSYRYLRLTPPYLLVIGFVQISTKWHHDHSVIQLTTLDHLTCEKFWWRNALYINTYFNMDDRCMVWSWYLANDTQFYTVGIIILIIAASYPFAGAIMTVVILVVSWATTAIISLNSKHISTIQEPFAHYESLYDKPWTRIGPYLIGMAIGWYLCKIGCKLRLNKAANFIGWTMSVATLLSIVYGLYGNNLDPVSSAMYTALSHSGWAISVGFILTACVTGYGGGVDNILSCKYIYPLSRLTYCAYLVHPALLRAIILRGEGSFHLTQGFVAIIFLGITVASYAVSLFLSLLFEAPMVSLLRIVHPVRQWKQN